MAKRTQPVIVWFRRDLRIADHAALLEAAQGGKPVIPLYIWNKPDEARWSHRGVAKAWQACNIIALDQALQAQYGSRLIVRKGDAAAELMMVAAQTKASAIYFNMVYEPQELAQEERVSRAASKQGIELKQYPGNLLTAPGTILTRNSQPYKVFTPFYRQVLRTYRHAPPQPAPEKLPTPTTSPTSIDVAILLKELPAEHQAIAQRWPAGEAAAAKTLRTFVTSKLARYGADHDYVAMASTSVLSPYLECGAISARQIWDAVERHLSSYPPGREESAAQFERQLIWREFSYHTLLARPELPDQPYHERFAAFPWVRDDDLLECWQAGLTGYPLVDAAMRQLSAEGWMPGRARMVAASFFVKHLMQSWVDGEQWFWERLIDADLACNAFNWQWVAGSGADAAPYFRVFNPVLQGRKFDPTGEYVRRHVPELTDVPNRYLHNPWEAPESVLTACGVTLGKHYPLPIVEHQAARERALSAYRNLDKSPSDM